VFVYVCVYCITIDYQAERGLQEQLRLEKIVIDVKVRVRMSVCLRVCFCMFVSMRACVSVFLVRVHSRASSLVIIMQESLSNLQGERWRQGVREFSVLNEGRDMMEEVVVARKQQVAVVEQILVQRAIRQFDSKLSESPMEKLHREGLEKQLRDCCIALNFSRGKLASLCVLQVMHAPYSCRRCVTRDRAIIPRRSTCSRWR